MKEFVLIGLFLAGLVTPGLARIWTSSDGRTLEGELVRVEGSVAVVKVGGKNVRIPFDKLSEEDVAFLKEEAAKAKVGTNELFGIALKPGTTMEVDEFMDDSLKEAVAESGFEPSKIVVKISLPADFDPKKPQKVCWMVGAIDHEADRKRGNIAMFRRGEPAREMGWIVIAADTNMGNPRSSMKSGDEGDAEFHYFLVSELAKAWPDFRSWTHACVGHSTGAEGVFYRLAQLKQAEVEVKGGFLSGCREAPLREASREARIGARDWRNLKFFQSTGDQDRVVKASDIESVTEDLQRAGIKEVKSETFPGNHTMNDDHLGEALAWFSGEKE